MSAVQAFFLGMVVAWLPSLIILAWILRHRPLGASDEPSDSLGDCGRVGAGLRGPKLKLD